MSTQANNNQYDDAINSFVKVVESFPLKNKENVIAKLKQITDKIDNNKDVETDAKDPLYLASNIVNKASANEQLVLKLFNLSDADYLAYRDEWDALIVALRDAQTSFLTSMNTINGILTWMAQNGNKQL